MLVLLDVGIFVSAAITPNGSARRVVEAGIAGRFEFVLCPTLLHELATVLNRPKFKMALAPSELPRFLTDVRGGGRHDPDPVVRVGATRDPDDDYLIALVLESGAELIVTGDRDLLDLMEPPVGVIGLRSFADRFNLS